MCNEGETCRCVDTHETLTLSERVASAGQRPARGIRLRLVKGQPRHEALVTLEAYELEREATMSFGQFIEIHKRLLSMMDRGRLALGDEPDTRCIDCANAKRVLAGIERRRKARK